ncbi:MAG: penicillin-binding transpeptidase domain-containing protein, partial [Myxococcota bacterium]|nr:penicillin-binding transpeptidase domain-containing protein [Myxococcota bacterium]
LARKLETHLDKDEILTLYLNQIYFGHGRWGIAEAARYYLGKAVPDLSVADAALLMALVPAPERLNPFDALALSIQRRNSILERMVTHGFLNQSEAARHQRIRPQLARRQPPAKVAPWFVDAVKRRLSDALGSDVVMTGGLRVHTTLDLDAQASVDAAMKKHLGDAPSAPQGAVVILDPASHEVRALSGGTNIAKSSFNRAIQARRQAGSTVKPFVFGAAFERGVLAPDSELDNAAVCYRGAKGPWCPRNASGEHDGQAVTVAAALTRSLNVIAVQALRHVGIGAFTDFVRRAGVRSPVPSNLTAALGSGEVTPLEMTNAYATLASGGHSGDPVLVRRVEDVDGRVVYAEREARRRAIPAALAQTLTEMLVQVVDEGTGHRAALDGVRVAGKTGTTSGRVDAWFIGYTVADSPGQQAAVAGVWMGHDDNTPLVSGSGGSSAAPLWADAMRGWWKTGTQHAVAR